MLIQVDVDSTLYDANALFYEVGTQEFGINWPETYYYWFGPQDIGTDLSTLLNVFRRCHSRDYVMKQTPYEFAADCLKGIVEDYPDIEIAYVSDRNEQQTTALRDWLEANGFLFTKDTFVAATKDKRHWMREKRPEVVIDDRVRTMIMARHELNAQVISLQHPHNMNLKGEVTGIHLVEDWHGVDEVLRNEVLPPLRSKAVSRTKELAA